MRGRVRVAIDSKVAMPCAWGIFRPTLMLPAGAGRWDSGRQRMVLMHELSHLKRRDPLHDCIARLCVTIFWMNPLVWLASMQSRLAAERATDDAVIATGCSSKSYADLLLQFAREAVAGRNPQLVLATPMAQGSTVGLRVEKILDPSQRRRVPRAWCICLLLAVIGLAAAMLGGVQEAQAQEGAAVQVPPPGDPGEDVVGGDGPGEGGNVLELPPMKVVHPEGSRFSIGYTADKMRRIILPRVVLEEATIEEALKYFQALSVEHDKIEKEEHHKGIKIVLKKGSAGGGRPVGPINLDLYDIPLQDALKFATMVVDHQFKVESGAVIVISDRTASTELITQSFRVPPDFLRAGQGGKKRTGVEILKEVGIEFPKGAGTVFNPATSELVVRNTANNLDLVQVFIDSVISDWSASTELITQTFRVPPDFLRAGQGGKKRTGVEILKEVGIEFPEGASASFIPATSHLVVRNTANNMDLVQVFVDSLRDQAQLPKVVNLRVEIYSLPKLDALELVERFDDLVNTDQAVIEIRKLVAAKKARLIASPSLVTRTGQRAKIGSGEEYRYVHGYTEHDGADDPQTRYAFFGTSFEVEPNVSKDGQTLEINLAVTKTFGEPVIRRATVKAPVSGKEMPVETVQVDQGVIQTSIAMLSGQTRLIGTLSPTQTESDQTLVVFVKAWISSVGKQVLPEGR